jgi:hypothetical protein
MAARSQNSNEERDSMLLELLATRSKGEEKAQAASTGAAATSSNR